MYEKLEACPSCNHPQFDNYLICQDYTVTNESFALVKCTKCELVFTNPRPKDDELGKYYQSEEYISHTDKGNSLINVLYKLVRSYTLSQKRKLINSYNSNGTVLDYGCGTGNFLKALQKKGRLVYGIEPDAKARKIVSDKLTSKIHSSIQEIQGDTKFDVVTAWHVIEHVSNLKETLKDIRKKINKGGYFIVAVPNLKSFDSTYYGEHWAAYDVPRHLYHFSQSSFKNLAEKTKFKLVDILPMKFDSFYVSILSEKYKSGKSKILRGFLTGLKSNSKAAKSGEYSSLIYVLKK